MRRDSPRYGNFPKRQKAGNAIGIGLHRLSGSYGNMLENVALIYKKLWKLLIDKDMKKKDLCERAGISPASVTKMGRNGHVTTEILVKICAALDCRIEDIVEIVPDHN